MTGVNFADAPTYNDSDAPKISYLIDGTTVPDLRGKTQQGSEVSAVFTVSLPAGVSNTFTLVSYTAPAATFDATTASQQQIYDVASVTVTGSGGPYTLTVMDPNSYYQVDFVNGPVINQFGPAGSNIFYTSQNRLFSSDNEGSNAYSTSQGLLPGDFATPAFWSGVTGQTLIKAFNCTSFNGSTTTTQLAQWLATTFPNLYGPAAGAHAMVSSTGVYLSNAAVAANFGSKFSGGDQQVLASALSLYATSSLLEGSFAAIGAEQAGFHVTPDGSEGDHTSVGTNGSAFGVANGTTLAVAQLLADLNADTSPGAAVSAGAGTVFTAVNSAGKVNAATLSDAGNAFSPAQVRTAYGVNDLSLDGSGQTIAIVDAYDDPSIDQSVDAFDAQFGLTSDGATLYDQYGPASAFLTVVGQDGTAALPDTDPAGAGGANWEMEEALDVEWTHAMAPGAQIVLVEANSPSVSDLMSAVATAADLPGVSVVSMSWGFEEGLSVLAADEALYDQDLTTPAGHQGVTFVASTGDYGAAVPQYPAFSPNVIAVGGTSLALNSDNSYQSESGWGTSAGSGGTFIGSGGGISQFEAEPSFQQGAQSTGFRTAPDVSFLADPSTGVWVADSYNLSADDPWVQVGGTSLSAPAWAGLIALADQVRVAEGNPTLGTNGPTEAQTALYSLPAADYHAVTGGTNGYTATAGYNLVTGLGTPSANLLIPDLAAYSGAPMSATSAGEQQIRAAGLTLDTSVFGGDGGSPPDQADAMINGLAVFGPLAFGSTPTPAAAPTAVAISSEAPVVVTPVEVVPAPPIPGGTTVAATSSNAPAPRPLPGNNTVAPLTEHVAFLLLTGNPSQGNNPFGSTPTSGANEPDLSALLGAGVSVETPTGAATGADVLAQSGLFFGFDKSTDVRIDPTIDKNNFDNLLGS